MSTDYTMDCLTCGEAKSLGHTSGGSNGLVILDPKEVGAFINKHIDQRCDVRIVYLEDAQGEESPEDY